MKLYAPEYYKDFVCIADKCKHSCCVSWEIDVDEKTLDNYNTITHPYGKTLLKSIDTTETPHFKLAENDRCPHLNEKGLCNIILNVGESYLCDICREHPRFYNYTARGKEVGIGISCEEACRIVLTSDNYSVISEIGNDNEPCQTINFDAVRERENVYKILSDSSLSYGEKLQQISEKYDLDLNINTDEEWLSIISSLEYLDLSHKQAFSAYSSAILPTENIEKYAERILAYFIYRHCSQADTPDVFRAALGFSLFCEKLFVSIVTSQNLTEFTALSEIARIISEEIEYSEDNSDNIKLEFLF